ncbi:MAG: carboxypeptidase M32, partial [bacterium]
MVGRSKQFWKWALPTLQKNWGKKFKKYDADDLYAATNTVTPSLIRVEADEGTYNMHVMVRFELERGIFSGDIKVKDLPSLWNAKYKEYLGVDVPDDRRGCLQDVHWSFGLIGYFPTYTLGNLYAAQFWEAINRDIPALDAQIRSGDFSSLLGWLRNHIHQHGRRYSASELCKRATGAALSPEPLMRNLEGKLRPLYGA